MVTVRHSDLFVLVTDDAPVVYPSGDPAKETASLREWRWFEWTTVQRDGLTLHLFTVTSEEQGALDAERVCDAALARIADRVTTGANPSR